MLEAVDILPSPDTHAHAVLALTLLLSVITALSFRRKQAHTSKKVGVAWCADLHWHVAALALGIKSSVYLFIISIGQTLDSRRKENVATMHIYPIG